MNRNAEWEAYVQDIKEMLPLGLTECAERAVTRARHTQNAKRLTIPAVAGVAVAFVALTALCNTSEAFARSATRNPVLRSLARALTANPSLRAITAKPNC